MDNFNTNACIYICEDVNSSTIMGYQRKPRAMTIPQYLECKFSMINNYYLEWNK